MSPTRYASLLDDPCFCARLDDLDVTAPPPEEHPAYQWFMETGPTPELSRTDAAWLGVVGFVAMMGLGGVAAAFVFADRVALILARL